MTSEVCIKTRSTLASLSSKGQVTEQTTVKWSIGPKPTTVLAFFTRSAKLSVHYLQCYHFGVWSLFGSKAYGSRAATTQSGN